MDKYIGLEYFDFDGIKSKVHSKFNSKLYRIEKNGDTSTLESAKNIDFAISKQEQIKQDIEIREENFKAREKEEDKREKKRSEIAKIKQKFKNVAKSPLEQGRFYKVLTKNVYTSDKRLIPEYQFIEELVNKNKGKSAEFRDIKGKPHVSFNDDTYTNLDSRMAERYAKYLVYNRGSDLDGNLEDKTKSESKEKPSSIKQQLEKALKGIQVAIDIAGETKELMKAKKGIEIVINLL